ncbi:MAG TPA: PPOX class F420-dependent oxidoreductase [Ktedonosporobacter sp.]|nr:PPOX class F420-dependent oxidoreductase [Ktedonosporobacter sp.]
MVKFTAEERKFLLENTHTAKVATVRKDGRPHVVPVWFDIDSDDTLLFTTWQNSVKGLSIKRDGRICLCVDDETPPFAFIVIEGTATLSANMDDLRIWATRLGGRYMGADKAEAYGKRNAVEGELLVRVTPTKVIFQKNVASFS